jgi:hypothetical protein
MADSWKLAGGRALPRLAFVTSRGALEYVLGHASAAKLLRALSDSALVFDELPRGATWPRASRAVQRFLAAHANALDGVVIVGGYDVAPSQRLDTLPSSLSRKVRREQDADEFVVWTDDGYGDIDGDGLPELPVSRVPDAGSLPYLTTLLSAAPTPAKTRAGIRNAERTYADDVFELLPGLGSLLTSEHTLWNERPAYALSAACIYIVLHGEADDGSRAWGQASDGAYPVAMRPGNVRPCAGSVVLCASCWAGLIVDTKALHADGRRIAPRSARTSIALEFLRRGALAFVGSTGSHYSPTEPPYHYNGEPLHRAFWQRVRAGTPPARALFEAKYHEYVHGIPHGPTGAEAEACELKVLHELTCLGLGW